MSELPPDQVMRGWQNKCNCCPVCSPVPCDGIMAGGVCDNLCYCDDVEDEPDDGMDECGMLPDGTCMLAGTEHCDFECKYRDETDNE